MYLIDSNIFIEAKNRYYAFDLAPSFWNFLDKAFLGPDVRSIDPVYKELTKQNDELADWIKARKSAATFLDISDADTQSVYASIANTLSASTQYNSPGVANFLSGADPWLAAKAKVLGATLVTHELYIPDAKRKVPLGNICHDEGIPMINTFQFLRARNVSF